MAITGGAPRPEPIRFLAELDSRADRKKQSKPKGVATYEKYSVSHLFHALIGKTMTVTLGTETKIVNKSSMQQFLDANFTKKVDIKSLSGEDVSNIILQIAAKSPNLTPAQKTYVEQIAKTPISIETSKDITAPKDRMMSFVAVLQDCGLDLKSKWNQWFPENLGPGDMVTIKASDLEKAIQENTGKLDPNKAVLYKTEIAALRKFQDVVQTKPNTHIPDVAPQVPQDDAAAVKAKEAEEQKTAQKAAEAKAKEEAEQAAKAQKQAATRAKFEAQPSTGMTGSARQAAPARPEAPRGGSLRAEPRAEAEAQKAAQRAAEEVAKAQKQAAARQKFEAQPSTGKTGSLRQAAPAQPEVVRSGSMRALQFPQNMALRDEQRREKEVQKARQAFEDAKAAADALAKQIPAVRELHESARNVADALRQATEELRTGNPPGAEVSVARAEEQLAVVEKRVEQLPAATQPAAREAVETIREAIATSSESVSSAQSSVVETPAAPAAAQPKTLATVDSLQGNNAAARFANLKSTATDFQNIDRLKPPQAKKLLGLIIGQKMPNKLTSKFDTEWQGYCRNSGLATDPNFKKIANKAGVNY